MKILNSLIAFSIVVFFASCTGKCGSKVDRAEEIIAIENVLEQYIIANS